MFCFFFFFRYESVLRRSRRECVPILWYLLDVRSVLCCFSRKTRKWYRYYIILTLRSWRTESECWGNILRFFIFIFFFLFLLFYLTINSFSGLSDSNVSRTPTHNDDQWADPTRRHLAFGHFFWIISVRDNL